MIYNVINDTVKRIVLFTFVRDCDALVEWLVHVERNGLYVYNRISQLK